MTLGRCPLSIFYSRVTPSIYQKVKAGIWPRLSHMCYICSSINSQMLIHLREHLILVYVVYL